MRHLLMGPLLLASLPALGSAADNDKDKPKTDDPAAQLQALFAEDNKANNEIYKPVQDAKTPQEQVRILERDKIYEKRRKLHAESARRILDFADKHPEDRKLVVEALVWVARNAENTPEAAKALDAIIRDHLDDKNREIDIVLASMSNEVSEPAEGLLRAAAEKVEDKERRTQARYFLARCLKTRAEGISLAKDEEFRTRMEQFRGKEYLERLAVGDPAKLLREAEDLYEALAKDSGDAKVFKQAIKELAASELFEIRNLAIGKAAPDIVGEDIDGKSFKLSDYRGKVVVLDFWGNW